MAARSAPEHPVALAPLPVKIAEITGRSYFEAAAALRLSGYDVNHAFDLLLERRGDQTADLKQEQKRVEQERAGQTIPHCRQERTGPPRFQQGKALVNMPVGRPAASVNSYTIAQPPSLQQFANIQNYTIPQQPVTAALKRLNYRCEVTCGVPFHQAITMTLRGTTASLTTQNYAAGPVDGHAAGVRVSPPSAGFTLNDYHCTAVSRPRRSSRLWSTWHHGGSKVSTPEPDVQQQNRCSSLGSVPSEWFELSPAGGRTWDYQSHMSGPASNSMNNLSDNLHDKQREHKFEDQIHFEERFHPLDWNKKSGNDSESDDDNVDHPVHPPQKELMRSPPTFPRRKRTSIRKKNINTYHPYSLKRFN